MADGRQMTDGRQRSAGGPPQDMSWADACQAFRTSLGFLSEPWEGLFGPLRQGTVDDLVVIGQCGQSIDARIATPAGHSHYINGAAGLAHLHRLRALVDAVIIGVGTATADDPQLTVRRVEGPSPARVILDPSGRLPPTARVLADDGNRRIVVTNNGVATRFPRGVEVAALAATPGHMAPRDVLAALAERGMRRILVEGGADTVSRFLAARCFDRLHIMVAPIIIGSGSTSLNLPPIRRVDEAIEAPIRVHVLGNEVLLDCDLSAQRLPIGRAKIST